MAFFPPQNTEELFFSGCKEGHGLPPKWAVYEEMLQDSSIPSCRTLSSLLQWFPSFLTNLLLGEALILT